MINTHILRRNKFPVPWVETTTNYTLKLHARLYLNGQRRLYPEFMRTGKPLGRRLEAPWGCRDVRAGWMVMEFGMGGRGSCLGISRTHW